MSTTIRFLTSRAMSSSWSCNKCTFLNSASQKLNCMICLAPVSLPSLSPPPPSLSISANDEAKWACKACTFLNTYKNSICDVCGTRSPTSSLLGFQDLTDSGLESNDADSSVGSVFFPLRRCIKRKAMDDDVVEVDGASVVCSESQGVMKKNKEIETKGRFFSTP